MTLCDWWTNNAFYTVQQQTQNTTTKFLWSYRNILPNFYRPQWQTHNITTKFLRSYKNILQNNRHLITTVKSNSTINKITVSNNNMAWIKLLHKKLLCTIILSIFISFFQLLLWFVPSISTRFNRSLSRKVILILKI